MAPSPPPVTGLSLPPSTESCCSARHHASEHPPGHLGSGSTTVANDVRTRRRMAARPQEELRATADAAALRHQNAVTLYPEFVVLPPLGSVVVVVVVVVGTGLAGTL